MAVRRRSGPVVIGRLIVIASALAIALATLVPDPGSPDITHFCLVCGTLSGVDAVLNVMLFAPFGAGLALMGVRRRTGIAIALGTTFTIELLQLLVIEGRHASIADVITNSLGAILGFAIIRHASTLLRPDERQARGLAVAALLSWIGVQAIVAYGLIPVPARPPYYGHIGRIHWQTGVRYPGQVVEGRLGSHALGDGLLARDESIEREYSTPAGALLEVTVQPRGVPPARAEIAVISGGGDQGMLAIEQDRNALIFSARTGADAVLLRPLEFRFRDAFRSLNDTAGPIRVTGRYGKSRVRMGVATASGERERVIELRLSQGWLLLMPAQLQIDDDAGERAAAAAYMIVLMIPIGFWGRLATRAPAGTRPVVAVTLLLVGMTIGLVLVPRALGLGASAPWEWALWACGVMAGALLARRARAQFPGRAPSQ